MSGLQGGSVVEGFIAAHPVAESMTNEDLLNAFALGELRDEVESVGDRSVKSGVAGVDDFARGIDRFAELEFAEEADMVIHLEGKAERVHFLVAAPTVFLASDAHAGAQGGAGFVG